MEWERQTAGSFRGLVGSALASPRPMAEVPRSASSSGLRLLLRLLSCVAMLAVLCISGRAAAAPISTGVPMCGDDNESVAAPPIFFALDDAAISSLPCHGPSELGDAPSAPAAPERVIVHERPERVLGFAALCVAQSASSRLPIAEASLLRLPPGFVASLFRPPRG